MEWLFSLPLPLFLPTNIHHLPSLKRKKKKKNRNILPPFVSNKHEIHLIYETIIRNNDVLELVVGGEGVVVDDVELVLGEGCKVHK